VKSPYIRRVDRASKTKLAHLLRITHRDEVEAPVTGWLREAYDLSDVLAARAKQPRAPVKSKRASTKPQPAAKRKVRKSAARTAKRAPARKAKKETTRRSRR
jgi:hypothetical protein